jgi:hypothetical protein
LRVLWKCPEAEMFTLIAACAIFWLLVFSYISYMLVRGHEQERYRYEELVIPCLIFAWLSVLGSLLYWGVSSLLTRD